MHAKNKIGLILLSPDRIDGWHWKIPAWAFPIQNNMTLADIKILECLAAGCKTVYVSVPLKWIPYFRKHYGEFFKVSSRLAEPDFLENSCQVIMLPSVPFWRQSDVNAQSTYGEYASVRLFFANKMISSLAKESLQQLELTAMDHIYVTTDRISFNFVEDKFLQKNETADFILCPQDFDKEEKILRLKAFNCSWENFSFATRLWFKHLSDTNISPIDLFVKEYLVKKYAMKIHCMDSYCEKHYLSVSSIYNDVNLLGLARTLSAMKTPSLLC